MFPIAGATHCSYIFSQLEQCGSFLILWVLVIRLPSKSVVPLLCIYFLTLDMYHKMDVVMLTRYYWAQILCLSNTVSSVVVNMLYKGAIFWFQMHKETNFWHVVASMALKL